MSPSPALIAGLVVLVKVTVAAAPAVVVEMVMVSKMVYWVPRLVDTAAAPDAEAVLQFWFTLAVVGADANI